MMSLMNGAAKPQILTTTTDQGWIDFVSSSSPDIFMGSYCGYWARGVDHSKRRGWLIFEHGGEGKTFTDDERLYATSQWRMGRKLPKGWYAFNTALANAAWVEGVRRFGEDWYFKGDGPRYDWAIQIALFGEVSEGKKVARYG